MPYIPIQHDAYAAAGLMNPKRDEHNKIINSVFTPELRKMCNDLRAAFNNNHTKADVLVDILEPLGFNEIDLGQNVMVFRHKKYEEYVYVKDRVRYDSLNLYWKENKEYKKRVKTSLTKKEKKSKRWTKVPVPSVVFKIALDHCGIEDNYNDALYDGFIKNIVPTIELTADGSISVQKAVHVFRLPEHLDPRNLTMSNVSNPDKFYEINKLAHKRYRKIHKSLAKLKETFMLVDVHVKNIRNYGEDENGKLVHVDVSDLTPLRYCKPFRCQNVLYDKVKKKPYYCNHLMDYDDEYTEVVCPNCGQGVHPGKYKKLYDESDWDAFKFKKDTKKKSVKRWSKYYKLLREGGEEVADKYAEKQGLSFIMYGDPYANSGRYLPKEDYDFFPHLYDRQKKVKKIPSYRLIPVVTDSDTVKGVMTTGHKKNGTYKKYKKDFPVQYIGDMKYIKVPTNFSGVYGPDKKMYTEVIKGNVSRFFYDGKDKVYTKWSNPIDEYDAIFDAHADSSCFYIDESGTADKNFFSNRKRLIALYNEKKSVEKPKEESAINSDKTAEEERLHKEYMDNFILEFQRKNREFDEELQRKDEERKAREALLPKKSFEEDMAEFINDLFDPEEITESPYDRMARFIERAKELAKQKGVPYTGIEEPIIPKDFRGPIPFDENGKAINVNEILLEKVKQEESQSVEVEEVETKPPEENSEPIEVTIQEPPKSNKGGKINLTMKGETKARAEEHIRRQKEKEKSNNKKRRRR